MSSLKSFMMQIAKEEEFDVSNESFPDLEIRVAPNETFHYFYDVKGKRLIKSFLLREGVRVDTLCDVILTKTPEGFTPRLTFWKKDKTTKALAGVLSEEQLASEPRTLVVKARVGLDDCHENFWKLINFLQAYKGIDVPGDEFHIVDKSELALAESLQGHDKASVLSAVKTYLEGNVTEQDVQLLLDRRQTVDKFGRLLDDPEFFASESARLDAADERVWQIFFEENTWIFGYGLTLVACQKYTDNKLEAIAVGSNVFTGGGKRSDAIMRTKGMVQALLFAEIKTHKTALLMDRQYRVPDVYQVSSQLSGAVSQVQKTAHKATKRLEDLHRAYDAEGAFQFEISTVRPRQVVIAGNLRQLKDGENVNLEKLTSFELYRRDHQGVEITTFDELFERTKFIVRSQEP
jgi:hypothetical protein